MTEEVATLVKRVEAIIGNISDDRYGYRAAAKMLDWPTRASLVLALHEVKTKERD